MSELENKNGVFKSDLMRTFRQLKESRAESVSEDVEIIWLEGHGGGNGGESYSLGYSI